MARRYTRGPFDPFDQSPFGGLSDVQIPRPPRRFWVGLGFIGAALLVILITAPVVNFLTETQWFDALGFRSVYFTQVGLTLTLFLGSLVLSFAFGAVNVAIALRIRAVRALRAVGIRQRTLFSGVGAIGLAATAVISLIISGGVGARWNDLALFLHASNTGTHDPVYGMDVGFYLLTLPFLHDIVGWLLALLFLVIILVVGLYGWRGETFDLRLPPRAFAHVSVLLALLALTLAGSSFLDRYDLLFAHNGYVYGAGYTDVHARSGLAVVRVVVAVLLAGALFANVALRRPAIILGAIGAWIALAIISSIYPAIVQAVAVRPSEQTQEAPYISSEIQFTRQAFGVDSIQTQQFAGDQPVSAQAVQADQATIQNLRLWDNTQIQDTYQQLQSIRTYYTFNDIEVDRYTINGQTVQVAISPRELDTSRLPAQAQSWVNQKLVYTHGYGVAASPVSAVVGNGLPDYVAGNIPATGPLQVTQPDIYFGSTASDYVLVPTAQPEFDHPQGGSDIRNHYPGGYGVPLDGSSRLLWAMRTGDFNLLISGQVQGNTQILYRRNVQDRIHAIAPFLQLYDKPYIVVVNGKLYWVQDAYTGASTYPYSQQQDVLGGQNYFRNSVKVVVDAYDGSTTFYISDPSDPIIRAYSATFPGMFHPLSALPAGLSAHLRVPTTSFYVQSLVYATYHVTDPSQFYNREDVWSLATGLTPYYVEMRLPGASQAEYLQIIPYTPYQKQNLVGWLAVRNDPGAYGQMVSYVLPRGQNIFGPQQIASLIQQQPAISSDRTLLNSNGSSIVQGNLLVVPVGNSFLYFEPWYLKSTTTSQAVPELKKVILADTTGTVAYQPCLDAALSQLEGRPVDPTVCSAAGPTTSTAPTQPGTTAPTVASLVAQAIQHYNTAQTDLKNGDLAGYANEMNQVGSLLQQINAAQTGSTAPSPSPSPRG